MQHRHLGQSGLKISPLCLGTMMFGAATDEPTAARIVARAKDQGVNFIDSADAYNGGKAEEIAGRAIGNQRHDWVLATKLANQIGEGANRGGLSRKWVMQAAEESLRRLGTDYIDVYYLHKEDHATPLAETVRAIGDLLRQGKIRYFGVSNYRSWRLAEICNLCDRFGIDRPVVSQPYYHALYRVAEVEHLPACAYYGLGVVSYSPLARGVLTGKYAPGQPPIEGSRAARGDKRIQEAEFREESLVIAQQLKAHAQRNGVSLAQFATAWVLAHRAVCSVIAGPRTLRQWQDYLPALDYVVSREDEALIDSLVRPGHPSTPGFSDPQYPLPARTRS